MDESGAPIAVAVRDLVAELADPHPFSTKGFHIFPQCIFTDRRAVGVLCDSLQEILNGRYDTGIAPGRCNPIARRFLNAAGEFSFAPHVPAPGKPREKESTTIHVVNAWRSNRALAEMVCSPSLGACVVRAMGWEAYGARVAQDQVWVKPPHSVPLSFHRDTPYLDFVPKEVCTVWVPLDDVRVEGVGTLEYCAGSHLWAARRGSANQFYSRHYCALLLAAAAEEGEEAEAQAQRLTPVLGEAGCCALHHGLSWHGSGGNSTNGWRRGIGIHFVRGDAVLAADAGKLWQQLAPHCVGAAELDSDIFPLTCPPLTHS